MTVLHDRILVERLLGFTGCLVVLVFSAEFIDWWSKIFQDQTLPGTKIERKVTEGYLYKNVKVITDTKLVKPFIL